MKKRSKWTIIISLLLVVTSAFIVLLQFEKKYSLRHYFDDWESESEGVFALTYLGNSIQYPGMDHYEMVFQDVEELDFYADWIYSIENGRIYFLGSEQDENQELTNWRIASMKTDKSDLQIHYQIDVMKHEKYYDLSNSLQKTMNPVCGGIYDDHHIYIKAYDTIVAYDIMNDTVETVDSLPSCTYSIDANSFDYVVISKNNESGRTITPESMAKTNAYVSKLLELEQCRTIDGESFLENFFIYARVLDGEIYLVCRIYNLYGFSDAILFQYDYETDTVRYVTAGQSYEDVSWYTSFIPIYEE